MFPDLTEEMHCAFASSCLLQAIKAEDSINALHYTVTSTAQMETKVFADKLWKQLQRLSLDDTNHYIEDPGLLLQRDGKVPCTQNNPGSCNLKALEAFLRLRRYSHLHSPQDIVQGARIALNSLSLLDEPGYAYFFFLFASHSWDLFERTKELQHLDTAVELFDHLREPEVEILGAETYAVVSVLFACVCMQYYLKEGEVRARETALEVLKEVRRDSSSLKWIFSSRTRTLIIIADVMRQRYEAFGPEEDLEDDSLDLIRSILDRFPNIADGGSGYQFNTLDLLVIRLVLHLSKEADRKIWKDNLQILYYLVSLASSPVNQTAPDKISTSKDALENLSNALDQCSISSSNRPLCLIFTAGSFATENRPTDVDVIAHDKVPQFASEWEKARDYFRNILNFLSLNTTPGSQLPHPEFQAFSVTGRAEHRSSQARVRFRQVEPDEAHICIFKFVIVPVGLSEENGGPLTHVEFSRRFRALVKGLSEQELAFLVQYPLEIDNLFATSKILGSLDEQLLRWKESPATMAYIFFLKGRSNLKQAGHMLSKISLDKEPGHTRFMYQLAASLRETEADEESLGLAAQLMQEFLRVQTRGTPLHFLAMVELASTLTLEYMRREGKLASFAVALELFREAVTARFTEPWARVAKKALIFGRILHNRYRFLEESSDDLERTMEVLDILWDIMPLGQPFRASVLELIVISALLYLSHDLDSPTWLKVLRHLTLAVDLYVNGPLEEGIGLDNEDKADISEILLSGGLDPSGYFYLSSQAMCLVHTADIIRSTAFDACSKPGFFRLSSEVYKRSLRLELESQETYEATSSAVAAAWASEKAGLRRAVLALGQDEISTFTLEPSSETLPIFGYRAVHMAASRAPTSFSHACLLRYYPTWLSYVPKQQTERVSSSPAMAELPAEGWVVAPWPDSFMSLPGSVSPASSQNRRPLPSTILPGIERVIEDEGSEIFRMPLELRTIRAIMRSLDDQVRGLEKSTSYMSESVIRWSNEPVYWNPRDVQLSTRMAQLKSQSPYFARLAQLQALLSRGPERCLELVESSRTLFWNRLLRLQTSFAGLPKDLADSLEMTANELDKCRSQFTASTSDEEVKWQWKLEGTFNSLLNRARQIPGFEKLLMPKGYEELLKASSGGPVVVLLGNDSTYAALIVRPSGVDSVFLTELTDQAIDKFIVGLNRASKDARSILMEDQRKDSEADEDDERYLGPKKWPVMPSYDVYLSGLWKLIVKPIFEFMGLLTGPKALQERPRLWWCPTGRFAFLPLHAAGINFGKDGLDSVSKYVVSSYTPTLSALITARENMRKSPKNRVMDLGALVLAQPRTPGHASLPMTLKEIELIEKFIPTHLLLHIGEGTLSEANANRKVEEATKYLGEASILHLACHGHQDRMDPLNSGFELSDGRLSLSKLISCRNPSAFLAFLSACESAANDVDIPDESLSLAAAMLFAGFRSVIGTMWTMHDNDGPQVSQAVYAELFRKPEDVLDPRVIPYALDAAVRKLQEDGVHASRWATYIHVGV